MVPVRSMIRYQRAVHEDQVSYQQQPPEDNVCCLQLQFIGFPAQLNGNEDQTPHLRVI